MKKTAWLGLLALIACAGTEAATTIKIATLAPDGTSWMTEMRAGADAVKKRTDDRVEIKYYPGGVMGDEPAVLRKIKIGQLQGGAFTGGELSQVVKDAQIYSLPFLFKSQDEVDKVRAQLDPMLKKSFEQAGFEAVGISGGGFAYLMSVKDIKNKTTSRPRRSGCRRATALPKQDSRPAVSSRFRCRWPMSTPACRRV